MSIGRNAKPFGVIHCSQADKIASIVFIALVLNITRLPGALSGGADEGFELIADRQIVDPSREAASFQDDQIAFVFLVEGVEVVSFGGCVKEGVSSGLRIQEAAHGIELTKNENDNCGRTYLLRVWDWI